MTDQSSGTPAHPPQPPVTPQPLAPPYVSHPVPPAGFQPQTSPVAPYPTTPPGPGSYPGPYSMGTPQQYPGFPYQPEDVTMTSFAPPPAPGYGPAASLPTPPIKKNRTGLTLGIVAGALALIMIAAAIIVVPKLLGLGAKDPKELATLYLKNLSEGKAAQAVSLLTSPPSDRSLLTDQVLKESLRRAPITDIKALPAKNGKADTKDVPVSFKIADRQVSTTLTVTMRGKRGIQRGTIDISLPKNSTMSILINGVKAGTESPTVFPGSYLFSTSAKYFRFYTEPMLIDDPASIKFPKLPTPTLNEEGTQIFREKIKADIEKCLAATTLVAGCGLDLDSVINGVHVKEGSLRRELSDQGRKKLDTLTPEASFQKFSLVKPKETLDGVKIYAQCDKSGAFDDCIYQDSRGDRFGRPSVDFSKPDPEVSWER